MSSCNVDKCTLGSCRVWIHLHCVRLNYLLTYLLTPWCRVLLEKLTGFQLVKKFPAFHGTRRFITAFTNVCLWLQNKIFVCMIYIIKPFRVVAIYILTLCSGCCTNTVSVATGLANWCLCKVFIAYVCGVVYKSASGYHTIMLWFSFSMGPLPLHY